jgi:hypothetical protein
VVHGMSAHAGNLLLHDLAAHGLLGASQVTS